MGRFSIGQFEDVFHIRNEENLPFVLIGGQAVNFWAERYSVEEPELLAFRPFTSRDIDFKGDQHDLKSIAKQLDLKPIFPAEEEMTSLAGVIPFKIGDLKSNIEVVRTVPGITSTLVDKAALTVDFAGRSLRIIDPVSLLCSKGCMSLKIQQSDRQDVTHLKIMVFCVRAHLRKALQIVSTVN